MSSVVEGWWEKNQWTWKQVYRNYSIWISERKNDFQKYS
jgi:hypothetical protein